MGISKKLKLSRLPQPLHFLNKYKNKSLHSSKKEKAVESKSPQKTVNPATLCRLDYSLYFLEKASDEVIAHIQKIVDTALSEEKVDKLSLTAENDPLISRALRLTFKVTDLNREWLLQEFAGCFI